MTLMGLLTAVSRKIRILSYLHFHFNVLVFMQPIGDVSPVGFFVTQLLEGGAS